MIPQFAVIEQKFSDLTVTDIPEGVHREMARVGLRDKISPGMQIAITAGSRGINQIPVILRAVVDEVRCLGGAPFIVPAMGSHGGATALGQIEILRGLGITEQSVGAPIRASMDTVQVGVTEHGVPVYQDAYAAKSDGIVVVARVKPHTDFHSIIESGLHKMIAIGLGKHRGAIAIHDYGIRGLREFVPEVAQVAIQNEPILCGLAVLENGYDRTARIESVLPHDFAVREPQLLEEARKLLPKLPVARLDAIIVGEMGKEISGTGMDTNIIGRLRISGQDEFTSLQARYVVVLKLSEASHGNATGIGLADFTTEKLMKEIDYPAMRENIITSSFIERGKIPMAFPSDRQAIEACLRCLWLQDTEQARLVYIPSTLSISRVAVSESVLPEVLALTDVELISPLARLPFGEQGEIDPHYLQG